jgi:hypothetical protein
MDEKRNCRNRMRARPRNTDLFDDCCVPTVPDRIRASRRRRFHGPVHGMRQSTLGRYALLGCLTASPFVPTTQPPKRCCGKRSKERLQDRTHTQRSLLYACMTTIERSSRAGVSVSAALRPTRACGWLLLSGSVTSPAASARSTRRQFRSCGRSRQTTYRGSPVTRGRGRASNPRTVYRLATTARGHLLSELEQQAGPPCAELDPGLDRLGAGVHRSTRPWPQNALSCAQNAPELVVVECSAGQRQPAELLGGRVHEPRVPMPEVRRRVRGSASK